METEAKVVSTDGNIRHRHPTLQNPDGRWHGPHERHHADPAHVTYKADRPVWTNSKDSSRESPEHPGITYGALYARSLAGEDLEPWRSRWRARRSNAPHSTLSQSKPDSPTTEEWSRSDGIELDEKRALLLALARKRQQTRWPGYSCVGDYFNGAYECDFVSPYTKGAGNIASKIFVLLQDWVSEDAIERAFSDDIVRYGRTLDNRTNVTLTSLLRTYFDVDLNDVYATNLFPFVKRGQMSNPIPSKDYLRAAREFALPQIRIIQPKLVICFGLNTFNAIEDACGRRATRPMSQAIASPFTLGNIKVWCQAHPANRGSHANISRDWLRMRAEASVDLID